MFSKWYLRSSLAVTAILLYLISKSFFISIVVCGFAIGNSIRTFMFEFLGTTRPTDQRADILVDILCSTSIFSILSILFAYFMKLSSTIPIVYLIFAISEALILSKRTQLHRNGHAVCEATQGGLSRETGVVLALALFGIVVAWWQQFWLPWPETFGTDTYSHVALIRLFMEEGGSNHLFSVYPYQFHVIMAAFALGCDIDPFILVRFGSFVFYPVAIVSVYLVTQVIIKKHAISILAAVMFVFVNEGGALLGVSYTFPSTYAFILYMIVMSTLYIATDYFSTAIAIISLFIAVAVYYFLILGVMLPVMLAFAKNRSKSLDVIIRKLIILSIMLEVSLILIYYGLPIIVGIPTYRETVLLFHFFPTFDDMIILIFQAYSWMQLGLLLFGFIAMILTGVLRSENEREFSDYQAIFLVGLFYLVGIFLPLMEAKRLEMYARPFFAVIIVIGAASFVSTIQAFFRRAGWSNLHQKVSKAESFFIITLLVTSLVPTAIAIDAHNRWSPSGPVDEEYLAFQWIKDRTIKGDYILTDPATGFLMKAFILTNCSTTLLFDGGFHTYWLYTELGNLVFQYLNSSAWDDLVYYDEIQKRLGNVAYIVVSPRTIDWLWNARRGSDNVEAFYLNRFESYDPSWAKFFEPRYTLVKQFGAVSILKMNTMWLSYEDSMDDPSIWYSDGTAPGVLSEGIIYSSNLAHPSAWHHLYTNTPSYTSQEDLYLEVTWKTDAGNLEGRVFGYTDNELSGNISFYTDYVYPELDWTTCTWKLNETSGFNSGSFESLDFSFQNTVNNWTLYISHIRIYGTQELDYDPRDRKVVYKTFPLDNSSEWSTNWGGLPYSNGTIISFNNSANPVYWFHLYTSSISISNQVGMFLSAGYYSNTTGPAARVFGFTEDNAMGAYAFYTDYFYPTPMETRKSWKLDLTPGYAPLPVETISFGIQSINFNWIFSVSFLQVYGYERI